jgi:hypothetical protein
LETITHNLVAVIIQILCFTFLLFPWNIIFTIILAFLSHILVDSFSIITYHTPEAQKEDKFWLVWHYIIYGLSILSMVFFLLPYWLSVVFANIIDLWDWMILRPIQKKKKAKNPVSNWGDKYYFHRMVDWTRDKLFFWLPQRSYKRSGVIIELIIICVLSLILVFLGASIFIP